MSIYGCTYEQIFRFSVCQNHRRISCTPVRFLAAVHTNKFSVLVFAKIIEGFLVHLYVFLAAVLTNKFSVLVFAKIIEGFLVHLYVFFGGCTYEQIFRDQKLA